MSEISRDNLVALLREKAETWNPANSTLDSRIQPEEQLTLSGSAPQRPDTLVASETPEADYLSVAGRQEEVPYRNSENTSRLRLTRPEISLPKEKRQVGQNSRYETDTPDIQPQTLDLLKSRLARPEKPFQRPESSQNTPKQPKYEEDTPNIDPKRLNTLFSLPNFAKTLPATTAALTHSPKPTQITSSTVGKTIAPYTYALRQPEHITGNSVVVSLADRRVVVYGKDKKMLASYPIYVGSSKTPTPQGQFRIIENIEPGPSEWFLGGRWLGFAEQRNKPGEYDTYGFHGWQYTKEDDEEEKTNPGWKTTTQGCVQLGNKDVANFSKFLGAGDPVTIINTHLSIPGVAKPSLPSLPSSHTNQSSMFTDIFKKLGGK